MTVTFNAWSRMWWIIGHHVAIDQHATVACRLCDQIYDSYSDTGSSGPQGHDLCAWSRQLPDGRWIIHCGYGSDFDMSEFWYIKDAPIAPVDGICDWCIRRMLRDGVIIDSGKKCQP